MSKSPRIIDDYVSITFRESINSPRNGRSTNTFVNSLEPKNDAEGFLVERENDTVRITDRKTGRRTEMPWSAVREASRVPIDKCTKCHVLCLDNVITTSKGPACSRECASVLEIPDPEETARP